MISGSVEYLVTYLIKMTITIKNRGDIKSAEEIIRQGYPAIAGRFGYILESSADLHWPVARVLLPFLVSIGDILVPEIKAVLNAENLDHKYLCITNIISSMNPKFAEGFRSELERIADSPTNEEREEELQVDAQAAMEELGWRECEE